MSQVSAATDHRACQDLRAQAVVQAHGFRDNDQLKANAAKLFASKAGDNFKKFKTV